MPDPVNHPSHYMQGSLEVIDAIDGMALDYHEGNIVKYVARNRFKGQPVQDLEKAQWYLARLIEKRKREAGVHCEEVVADELVSMVRDDVTISQEIKYKRLNNLMANWNKGRQG